jgi:hypothetical protein
MTSASLKRYDHAGVRASVAETVKRDAVPLNKKQAAVSGGSFFR